MSDNMVSLTESFFCILTALLLWHCGEICYYSNIWAVFVIRINSPRAIRICQGIIRIFAARCQDRVQMVSMQVDLD